MRCSGTRSAALLGGILCLACSKDGDLRGVYSSSSFLTVEALPDEPMRGSRAYSVCAGSLQIDSHEGGAIRGWFTRRDCPDVRSTVADARGEVFGTVLPDGTATLWMMESPLESFEAVRTSGGCPNQMAERGPYLGRVSKTAISLSSRFRLSCAARFSALSFDVEYRIEATRGSGGR